MVILSLLVLFSTLFHVNAELWCTQNTQLAGGTFCLTAYDIPLKNSFEMEIHCPRVSLKGWCGVGIGKDMANSDIWMFWLNSSNQVVVSDRWSESTKTPKADQDQNVKLISSNILANGSWIIKVQRLYSTGDNFDKVVTANQKQAWFWAMNGNIRPTGDAFYNGNDLQQHDYAEIIGSVDLFGNKVSNGSSNGGNGAIVVPDDNLGYTDPNRWMMICHGVFMFLAWGILTPVAVGIGIFAKKTSRFPVHWWMMLAVLILTIIGFIFVVSYLSIYKYPQFNNVHAIIGIIVIGFSIIQALLGVYIHAKFDAARLKRPTRNVVHLWIGRILALLSFIVMMLGIYQYTQVLFTSSSSTWYIPLMCVCGILVPLIYAISFGGLWKWKKGTVVKAMDSKSEMEMAPSPEELIPSPSSQSDAMNRRGYVKSQSVEELAGVTKLADVENSWATSDLSVASDVGLLRK